MLKAVAILFLIVFMFGIVIVFIKWDKQVIVEPLGEGEPLFLTNYLKNGSMERARKMAKVHFVSGNIQSYAGFLTVDERYGSNLYFWYSPAENDPEKAPVALWLQGGPGVSSMYGLFLENGPYRIGPYDKVINREDYWSKYLHVIYIDSSVGTGFSFTRNEAGYPTDGPSVADNLYEALLQFFVMFPEINKNEFYVAGESYGGKYVPELSKMIHKNNPISDIKINLKGLTIGNGIIDPIHQMIYSEYLHEIALIDTDQKQLFHRLQNKIITLMKNEQWLEANHALSDLITNEFGRSTLFTNETGFKTYTNYLVSNEPNIYKTVDKLVKNNWLRRKIHVGNLTFTNFGRNKARSKMDSNVMKPAGPSLAKLMNDYRVLLYNGQLDIFLAYPGTENSLKRFTWCGSNSYSGAKRKPWIVDGLLAGYVKTVSQSNCTGTLTMVLVRNAGHLVPRDQPVWALDLIKKFTKNIPLN